MALASIANLDLVDQVERKAVVGIYSGSAFGVLERSVIISLRKRLAAEAEMFLDLLASYFSKSLRIHLPATVAVTWTTGPWRRGLRTRHDGAVV